MKKMFILIGAMLAFSTVFAAAGNSQVVEKPLVAQTLDSFMQESAKIRAQMEPGEVYGYIKPADKARVETRLGEMQRLLEAHASEQDMHPVDKVALANAQEEVNGILRRNDYNRLVCENKAPMGSHIPVTTCKTYGELMIEREQSQRYIQRKQTAPGS